MTINVLVSSNLCFHPFLSYGKKSQKTTLSIFVRVSIWVLSLYKLEALGVLMCSLHYKKTSPM